jgi:hypothetical protein
MVDQPGGAVSLLGVIICGVIFILLVVFLFGGFGSFGGKSIDVSVKAPSVSSTEVNSPYERDCGGNRDAIA